MLDGGPGASSCAFARSLIPHFGDWTVDAIGQLLVRELILVSHGLLQPEQLSLPRRGERKLPIYPIGSTSALLVNLEACNACGVSNGAGRTGRTGCHRRQP